MTMNPPGMEGSLRLPGILIPAVRAAPILFRILATLMRPMSGAVHILGHNVATDPLAAKRNLGLVFQNQSLDRRLTRLAEKFGWRYTRYADDLTFSLPQKHKGEPKLGALIGQVTRVVGDEGFQIHPEKTRVARAGGCQRVTGLVVNGDGTPRVPRKLKRQIRAAIHRVKNGGELREGESLATLQGYAAFIAMVEPELGFAMMDDLAAAMGRQDS